jgi:Yip1 domain
MADTGEMAGKSRGLSQVERVVDVFVAPTETFRDILRSTSWWVPYLLLAVASLGVVFAIERQVGWEQVAQTQLHMSPRQQSQMADLAPDEQAQRMHGIVLGYRYGSYGYPVLMLALSALAALVLWASFNFGLGARTTYGQMLCLWMYCSLPRLLAALITVVMLCFGGSPESFNLKEPVGTNPAYYMPDAWPWLRALLSYCDVIGIWVLALLIVGGAIVAKVKWTQAALVVVGWWLLMVLVGVAAAAAFG